MFIIMQVVEDSKSKCVRIVNYNTPEPEDSLPPLNIYGLLEQCPLGGGCIYILQLSLIKIFNNKISNITGMLQF